MLNQLSELLQKMAEAVPLDWFESIGKAGGQLVVAIINSLMAD